MHATEVYAAEKQPELEQLLQKHVDMMRLKETITDEYEEIQNHGKLKELSHMMHKVSLLTRAQHYIRILMQVHELQHVSRGQTQSALQRSASSVHALDAYTELATLVRETCESLEYKRLSEHLYGIVDGLWDHIQNYQTTKLNDALTALEWPKPLKPPFSYMTELKLRKFKRTFLDVLHLKRPTLSILDKEVSGTFDALILAMQVLLDPILVRFEYHFYGKRPTNRIDRPEWHLTHMLNVASEHSAFLDDYCQPLVIEASMTHCTAKQVFLAGLVEAIVKKLDSDSATLLQNPQLLSHTIREALLFDATLRDVYGYHPVDEVEWPGTAAVFILDKLRFKIWMDYEKQFADKRFQEIIEQPNAWDSMHDDDDAVPTETEEPRPTHSAEALVNLMEIITDRYQPLPTLGRRLRFLLDIQLPLIERYLAEITERADAFDHARHGVFGTTSDIKKKVLGTSGLNLLCRWLESLEYVASTLREWGEQVFFLEMWRDVSRYQDKVLSPISTGFDFDDEGTIFDDVLEAYRKMSDRLRTMLVKCVARDFLGNLGPYSKKRMWSAHHSVLAHTIEESTDMSRTLYTNQDENEISNELAAPLAEFSMQIGYLAQNLPHADFHDVYRKIAADIDDWMWSKLVYSKQFGRAGEWQLVTDFNKGLCGAGAAWLRKPERYFPRMKDVTVLMQLPFTHHDKDAAFTVDELYALLKETKQDHARNALDAIGVYSLGLDEAMETLERRM